MNARTSLWLALPLAILASAGCNNAAGTGTAPEAAGASTAAVAETPAAAHHEHHRHAHSPAAMLLQAAKKLDLTADQRTSIANLEAGLRADRGAMHRAQQDLRAALVAGVRAGNIDLARLQPREVAVEDAHKAHVAREAAALNGLYATLQPAQRQALVASVRARQAARAEKWAGEHEGRVQGEEGSQRVLRLTNQLGLDAEQQQRVAAMIASQPRPAPAEMAARRDARKARMEALLTAFASDSFEANKLDLGGREQGVGREQHHAAFLAQLVPILRADQRDKLAASMEARRD
jgi:Spy/CpxP family protein refolding chaperone